MRKHLIALLSVCWLSPLLAELVILENDRAERPELTAGETLILHFYRTRLLDLTLVNK